MEHSDRQIAPKEPEMHWLWHSTLAFVLVFGLLSVFYGYPEILTKGPQGLHAWRQSDCLSLTRHYQVMDLRFHESRMHFLGSDGTGRAISDFPIIYYSIGHIWKVTGKNESIFRLAVLAFFYFGMYCLFVVLLTLLKSTSDSLFITALLFTSPMLAYYANNFLMNVPALSVVFMSWLAFILYLKKRRRLYLFVTLLLCTLAGLLKVTASISLIAIAITALCYRWSFIKRHFGLTDIPSRNNVLIGSTIGLIILVSWYKYAQQYNDSVQGVFLVGVLPIWDLSFEMIANVLAGIKEHFGRDYFRPFLYPFLALALTYVIVRFKQMPAAYRIFLTLTGIGVFMVQMLFFQPLEEHDYYSIDQLILFPLVIGGAIWLLRSEPRYRKYKRIINIAMVLLLIHCADFTRRRMADRYSSWMNHEYLMYMRPLGLMEEHLLSIGIQRDSKIVCLPDPSFNRALYLLDRRGWSDFDSVSYYPKKMNALIEMGAEFMIIYEPSTVSRPGVSPFITKELEPFEHVRIFDLRK